MAVRVMVLAHIRDEDAEAFEAAFAEVTRRVRGTPGHRGDELLRSASEPGCYILLSEWESREAFVALGGRTDPPPDDDTDATVLVGSGHPDDLRRRRAAGLTGPAERPKGGHGPQPAGRPHATLGGNRLGIRDDSRPETDPAQMRGPEIGSGGRCAVRDLLHHGVDEEGAGALG